MNGPDEETPVDDGARWRQIRLPSVTSATTTRLAVQRRGAAPNGFAAGQAGA